MASFFRFAGRTAPSMAATALAACGSSRLGPSFCESAPPTTKPVDESTTPTVTPGFQAHAEGHFYDTTIPMSQLYRPKLPWPMWDADWDRREPAPSGDDKLDRRRRRYRRNHGVTRHILLVRHGQYDETHKEDERRILTELGRRQAHQTGRRLAQMLQDHHVSSVRVSGLARAKETADIIASYLPHIPRAEPDPLLNEARPCHTVPSGGKISDSAIQKTAQGHVNVEAAFQKYFYRSDDLELPPDGAFLDDHAQPPPKPPSQDPPEHRHEYEIIVCHANVIRYFLCRALQLPPEAWLRLCTFNCSLTYLTIRPTGGVSCRMLGDIGHLPPEMVTFSGHHGFNW